MVFITVLETCLKDEKTTSIVTQSWSLVVLFYCQSSRQWLHKMLHVTIPLKRCVACSLDWWRCRTQTQKILCVLQHEKYNLKRNQIPWFYPKSMQWNCTYINWYKYMCMCAFVPCVEQGCYHFTSVVSNELSKTGKYIFCFLNLHIR